MTGASRPAIRCLFRVAAGARMGFGHLMRARALAQALGVRPVTSLRGGAAARRAARQAGCALTPRLPAAALARYDAVVVDDPSSAQTRTWLARASRAGVRSLAIQDRGTPPREADLVVDGLAAAAGSQRDRCLCGPRFCILDPRIARLRQRRPRGTTGRRPRVVIALGGGSHVRRFGPPLAAAILRRVPRADVRVAAGLERARLPALRGGRWLIARRGLAHALARADVAVVAGGVTLSEACALGVPTVGVPVVGPQRRAIRLYASLGIAVNAAGSAPARGNVDRAARAVARLLEDRALRRRMRQTAMRVIDGRGADRAARRLRRLVARGEDGVRG